MLDRLARSLEVSTTVAALLVVLVFVQVSTQVFALIDLARRNRVRGGKKWVWAIAVALGNLPGAIAYLAVGRTAEPDGSAGSSQPSGAGGEAAARRAVDALYGPTDRR